MKKDEPEKSSVRIGRRSLLRTSMVAGGAVVASALSRDLAFGATTARRVDSAFGEAGRFRAWETRMLKYSRS